MENTTNEVKTEYINSKNEAIEVSTLNNFHLVNSLIKGVKLTCVLEGEINEIANENVEVLKAELLKRIIGEEK